MRHAVPDQKVRFRLVEIMLLLIGGFVHQLSFLDAIQPAKGRVTGTAAHSGMHWARLRPLQQIVGQRQSLLARLLEIGRLAQPS